MWGLDLSSTLMLFRGLVLCWLRDRKRRRSSGTTPSPLLAELPDNQGTTPIPLLVELPDNQIGGLGDKSQAQRHELPITQRIAPAVELSAQDIVELPIGRSDSLYELPAVTKGG